VNTAIASIAEDSKEAPSNDKGSSVSRETQTRNACIAALKRELDRLVQREMIQRPETIIVPKGVRDEPWDEEDANPISEYPGDNVLTLLAANTQPSKQLFTSIRKPTDSSLPLGELALPNGITTTRITPLHSTNEDPKKPVPTLKDLFAPPPSLPPLPLPKQSRHTATRSSSVNWYNPAEGESKNRSGRKESYTNQPLSTGQWLKYSVAPNPTQLASPETKRKQRDRALSIGEPQTSLSQEAIESHNQAKEDALFRSVYSSFAPDRDDSGALVADQQKNKLWWNKYGETRYQELLDLRDSEILDPRAADTDGIPNENDLNEEELEEAIANFQPDDSVAEMRGSRTIKGGSCESSQDADELLEEISDLLETLHSHQRIRNLPLAANTRPIAGQNPESTTLAGSPTSPSATEFDVYEMLKDQLTMIVSTLPPYLLSKLDGEKLGALCVSTNIHVESKDQKGCLEESEASATARRAAAPSAVPMGTSQNPSTYSTVSGRSNNYLPASTPAQQYPRTGYGPSTAPRPAASSSYLQNPQFSNRPASSNYASGNARPSYPPQSGYPPRAAAVSSTPSYNYAQQYSQQSSQSSYAPYQNGYRPYSGQNASSYNYNTQYSTPQARAPSNPGQPSQSYRETQSEYQQRAVPPQGYGYGSAQAGGGAAAQNQHRPASSAPTAPESTPQRPQLHQQHSSQYSPQIPGSPQVKGTTPGGSTSQQAHSSADDQAILINRQKVQLAEQQSRPGSGSPQPPSRQYSPQSNGIQSNGTASSRQNGIAAGQG
jgi:hypothetical protein